jgi:RNA polymerase sigma-70 factor, ECF subfamily
MASNTQASVGKAREEFLALVGDLRPELHRYCARLTGSVIEGEDIVQETLAKAFYTLSLTVWDDGQETAPLRPWLFKIAHNTAVDFLKSHGRKTTESRADLTDVAGFEERADPLVVRAALARFIALPLSQRSAVILKDVLDHSLEEVAETMGTTVMAVKAALHRGRAKLTAAASGLSSGDEDLPTAASTRADLDRYASLFNARDWDGLRAMISDDCRLDLVSASQRRGKQVGMYFDRYAKRDIRLSVVRLEGQLALAAHLPGGERPAYFILLELEGGRVTAIRDYRYIPYVAAEAQFEEP